MTPQTLLSRGTKRFLFICLQITAISVASWLLWFVGTFAAQTFGWVWGTGQLQPLALPALAVVLYLLVDSPRTDGHLTSSSDQAPKQQDNSHSTTFISQPGRYRAEGNRIIQN